MRNYATLFDSRYLPQGLALYESLVQNSSEPFVLYVLPMDLASYSALRCLKLEHAVIQNAAVFESEMNLESAKATRTHAEYCWTSASNFAEYLMRVGLTEISYVDSDCWFMQDPEIVFAEIGKRSIGIVPHRFTDNADRPRLEKSGRFNVSLTHFKNSSAARACLSKWAAQVRERCSADSCGDQLYLNSWDVEYGSECAVIGNIGVGVAPWNLQQYALTEGPHVDGVRVCMYHFHETRFIDGKPIRLTNYALRPEDIRLLYTPYIAAVEKANLRIAESLYLQTI